MNLADKLGFGPKRELTPIAGGLFELKVTPPPLMGFATSTIVLTTEQVVKYEEWRQGSILIQDAFPELSNDQREIIMSGIGPEEFNEAFNEEEE